MRINAELRENSNTKKMSTASRYWFRLLVGLDVNEIFRRRGTYQIKIREKQLICLFCHDAGIASDSFYLFTVYFECLYNGRCAKCLSAEGFDVYEVGTAAAIGIR